LPTQLKNKRKSRSDANANALGNCYCIRRSHSCMKERRFVWAKHIQRLDTRHLDLLIQLPTTFYAKHVVALLRGLRKDREGMPLILEIHGRMTYTSDVLGLGIFSQLCGSGLEVQCNTLFSISFKVGILNQTVPHEVSNEVINQIY
jgi:hypothetical protein